MLVHVAERWSAVPEVCRLHPYRAGIGGGVLMALAFPPRGWWPLALVGLGLFALALAGQPGRRRFVVGVATGASLYATPFLLIAVSGGAPVLVVVAEMFAALVLSLFVGITATLVPAGRPLLLGFPAALVLIEALQARWPWGGLPAVGIALGQVDGPLAPVASLAGQLGVVAAAVVMGTGLAAWWLAPRRALAPVVLAGIVALAAGSAWAPDGRAVDTVDVALVQGGGQRGVDATPYDETFRLHVEALGRVETPVDLVVLPEGTAHVADVREPEIGRLALQARLLDATLVAGVVESLPAEERFLNAALTWGPDGALLGRYDKVHGVPFAEYIPGRGLLERFVDLSLVPRDLKTGVERGLVDTPAGRLGLLVSFEVFFSRLARDVVRDGAELVVVPTNASSFTDSQVPSYEVAASQYRALETGRYVLQVTPTGYTAIVDPDGDVVRQTRLGPGAQVVEGTVELRTGRTVFTRVGEWPLAAAAALALGGAWWWQRRRPEFLPSS